MATDTLQKWGSFDLSALPADMLAPIHFPVLFQTGLTTGDGRTLGEFSGPRNLPIPIQIQRIEADGHDGAIVVGRLDAINQTGPDTFEGFGWLLDDSEGQMAARMVRTKSLRGQSPRLVDVTFQTEDDGTTTFTTFSVGAVTLVPVPAFGNTESQLLDMAGATVTVAGGDAETPAEDAMPGDAEEDSMDGMDQPCVKIEIEVMAAVPMMDLLPEADIVMPASAFKRRDTGAQPVRVYEDNTVWGYAAKWGECQIGQTGRCVLAPKSPTNYAHFANKAVLTDEGFVNTGPLVLGGSHGPRGMSLQQARDHYAETSLAWADVAIGEDEIGIWVAGMVRPGTSPETIYAARASGVSGHWLKVNGQRDMVAILSVNTPGFNSARPSFFAVHDEIIDMRGLGAFPAEPIEQPKVATATGNTYVFNMGSNESAREFLKLMGQSGGSGGVGAFVITNPADTTEVAASAEDCGCNQDDLGAEPDPELELAVAKAKAKMAQRKMTKRAKAAC